MKVADRVAVVAGVGHRVSNAIARRLVEEGACVILGGDDPNALLRASGELYGWPPKAQTLVVMAADDAQSAEDLVQAALESFGHLDIAISAWVESNSPAPDQSDGAQVVERNLYGALYLAQAAARAMRSQGYGRIISVSAQERSYGQPSILNAAARAGIAGLTRQLANELGRDGITVNCLAPGGQVGETFRLGDQGLAGTHRAEAVTEIAEAALFFASDEAQHITGQTLSLGSTNIAAPSLAQPAAAV